MEDLLGGFLGEQVGIASSLDHAAADCAVAAEGIVGLLLMVHVMVDGMVHVLVVLILFFDLAHLREGLAMRARPKNTFVLARDRVASTELVSAKVAVLVLGFSEYSADIGVLIGIRDHFDFVRLRFLTLIAALCTIVRVLKVLLTGLLRGLLLQQYLGDCLHDCRLCAFVELMTLLALDLFDNCLSLVCSANFVGPRTFFSIFLVVQFDALL